MLKYNRSNTAPTMAQMRKLSGLPMVKDADNRSRFIDANIILDSLELKTYEKIKFLDALLQESEKWGLETESAFFSFYTFNEYKYHVHIYFNNFSVWKNADGCVYRISHIVEAKILRFGRSIPSYNAIGSAADAVLHFGNNADFVPRCIFIDL